MTEAEWLACEDPMAMLESLRRIAGDRKFRLFAASAVWPHVVTLEDHRIKTAIEVAEIAAETLSHNDFRDAIDETGVWVMHRTLAGHPFRGILIRAISLVLNYRAFASAADFNSALDAVRAITELELAIGTITPSQVAGAEEARRDCSRRLVANVRDIFGLPFRSVGVLREWRTDTVLTLARQMYESREFSAMPILADALQDAGCNVETLLSHCRDTSLTHVRGCWVVDLVLGKE